MNVPFIKVPNDIFVGEHNIAVLHNNLKKFTDYCKSFNIKIRFKYYPSLLKDINSISNKIYNKYAELPYFGDFTEKEIKTVSNIYHMSIGDAKNDSIN